MGVPAFPVSGSIGRPRTLKARATGAFDHFWQTVLRQRQFLWVLALLLLIPIKDTQIVSADSMYERAHQLFLRGDLIRTQHEAEQGYRRYVNANPEQAAKFQLLLARALISRGMNQDALKVLASVPSIVNNREATIEKLTLEGVANTYLRQFDKADRTLRDADALCRPTVFMACSSVSLARGALALEQGKFPQAHQMFMECLSLARTGHDRRSETLALLNLAHIANQTEHYDEALDWANAAYRISADSGWEDRTESAQGNLGWAYFELGDKEKALELFLAAEQTATRLGDIRFQIIWISDAAYVYRDQGDLDRAAQAYRKSLELAKQKQINSQQDVINALEDLAHTDVMAGKLDDASATLDHVGPLVRASGSRVDELDIMLAQGEIAAARRQDAQAESIFRTVQTDPASQTSMRLGAEHQLAKLYEIQGNSVAAESAYRTALTTFEAARADLKREESKLPFLTNATPIYDDYIHLLVQQGRTGEALAAADQSRARTLAQGLGWVTGKPSLQPAALRAGDVARKSGSTILFYWLGEKESYLWAISSKKTSLFLLPRQREIAPLIERYRKALLEPALGREAASADGMALYRMLVGPAGEFIEPNANVVVVCDGPLSLLNFETLIVPGTTPHYWIEDANVVSAPSLYMLAAAKPSAAANHRLLLLGDALPPNPDYPRLPMARAEMEKIANHFAPADETVFARQAANSGAYLNSPLRNYAYIHFVAHGVASRTDPLDSAIILSRTGAAEDSFKLHAREIIQHPIDARLVTISACYGGGTRSYAGEGLVGLSWAFLRAGAHNVIGALWEASDDSTPQLMDKMYAGLAEGMSPSAALRQAKLAMLHSEGKFKQPFYWAPFQVYAGM
jgi:CHAT domain-containing protein/Tfp pilus assembly protein PilF